MPGASEFEDRLKRLIHADHTRSTSPSWSATIVVFVSGIIVGFVLRPNEARVLSGTQDKVYTPNKNR